MIDYDDDLEIDESMLDVECLGQAKLMMQYTKHEALCEKEKDKAKETLNLVKAEIDTKIRKNPEKYKLEKVTEGAVTAIILQSEEYKEANEEYLEKCFEYNVSSGAVKSFAQRKDMLELLVRLHGQQYFAGPRVPHDLSEQRKIKEQQKEKSAALQSGVASKMKRSK